MKSILSSTVLLLLLANSATSGTLNARETESLRADIAAITAAFERGDAEIFIERTHPSLQNLAGSAEAFAEMTRQSVQQLRQSGVKFLSSEVGTPTQTYLADDEEVCFVPRASVMELKGTKVKSTTFMIAIRGIGNGDWKYLDGAGLRKNPEMLYQLLPKLERGILLPPNSIEIL